MSSPLTTPFHVRVLYGDDSIRVYRVHAESLGEAENIALAHANEMLYVSASEFEGDEDVDGELGSPRVALEHAEVAWFDGDGEHDPGFVCYGRMSDGGLSFPLGHPQTFPTEASAWKIAHLLRFDEENGFLSIVATTSPAS